MSEGQKFEIPPKSNEPQNIESVLENWEISSVNKLKGHLPISVVRIKDDGVALFRPEATVGNNPYGNFERGIHRIQLELLAYKIDKILGFNLVPEVVLRQINNQNGIMQRFVDDATVACDMLDWEECVDHAELLKAAIFDHLINAQDRAQRNFLVNPGTGKIWLVDHDQFMMNKESLFGSRIIEEAKQKNLIELSEELAVSVGQLIDSIETLLAEANDNTELKIILKKIEVRAKALLEQKRIV